MSDDLDAQRAKLEAAITARRWYARKIAADMGRSLLSHPQTRAWGHSGLLPTPPAEDGVYVITTLGGDRGQVPDQVET